MSYDPVRGATGQVTRSTKYPDCCAAVLRCTAPSGRRFSKVRTFQKVFLGATLEQAKDDPKLVSATETTTWSEVAST